MKDSTSHTSDDTFSGIWRSCYWYPSNDHAGEDTSEYYAEMHQKGDKLTMQSLPNEKGAYILVKLSIHDDLATGTWEEHTSPNGPFKGAVYSGALQLIIDRDKKRMEGKWVGVGHDYELDRMAIFSGNWELRRAGQHETKKA